MRTGTYEVRRIHPWLGGGLGHGRLTGGKSDRGDPIHNLDISERISLQREGLDYSPPQTYI